MNSLLSFDPIQHGYDCLCHLLFFLSSNEKYVLFYRVEGVEGVERMEGICRDIYPEPKEKVGSIPSTTLHYPPLPSLSSTLPLSSMCLHFHTLRTSGETTGCQPHSIASGLSHFIGP